MQKVIDTIAHKEMTRKEFLATVGVGLVSLTGLSSILKLLSGGKSTPHHAVSSGYGSSPYGS